MLMAAAGIKGAAEHTSPTSMQDESASLFTTIISEIGDLILCISHSTSNSSHASSFRVDSQILRARSKYFARLLDGRFGEGEQVTKIHGMLKQKYGGVPGKATESELPVINIEDIGRISAVKSIVTLCKDFLSILHGLDLQTSPPVQNLANLAIVADRFDALEAMRIWVRRKKIIAAIIGKTTSKVDNALPEEKVRQRLLVSVLLDHGPWLEKYSQRIVVKGWTGKEALDTDPLWWDLPSRLEEELALRRASVLETIQSLQTYFITLYTSRERQCRLGYDSSAECDIFQLGQTIRFLSRIGTLKAQGIILETEPTDSFQGDLHGLIDALRQCPEYQINSHHSHCGIRTKLIPLLQLITEALQHVGVCAECWSDNRAGAWTMAKRPLLWKRASFRIQGLGHKDVDAAIRTLFTAGEREWDA